ncbi:MAG: hypothetical protein NZM38_04715 [Cytophagales bacterium]|nr:hypothetical protein [Cytophagales bacterium]MDW8384056.1 hypothetical protein [Flammeovirgaceae bacterium]
MNTSNLTASSVLPQLQYSWETAVEKDYGKLFILPEKSIIICELTKQYVPIEEFREIFSLAIPLIEKYQIKKFIFDKQNLRVFHQPSMEWYFIHWKQEVYKKGLSIHRKILPKNQPVFEAAVAAGRAKIQAEYPNTIIHLLDIKYSNSIEEAIES